MPAVATTLPTLWPALSTGYEWLDWFVVFELILSVYLCASWCLYRFREHWRLHNELLLARITRTQAQTACLQATAARATRMASILEEEYPSDCDSDSDYESE